MTEKDIRSEIEELKSQLEMLSRTKEQGRQTESGATPLREDEAGGGSMGGWFHDIVKQAEELWSGLDIQLNDVPAKTALVIFALGVLTGRLLSKRE
jgi:hypothetical protein